MNLYKIMCLASATLLSACSVQNEVADPSPAQAKVAEIAYNDLRDGKYDEFLDQLDPKLQKYFQDNDRVMKRFSHAIPEGEYQSKTLMVKSYTEQTGQPSEFKISYELAYPGNLVQYDVSFDKPNGSTQIQDFNIRVFGQ